jgi:hypothetical protein
MTPLSTHTTHEQLTEEDLAKLKISGRESPAPGKGREKTRLTKGTGQSIKAGTGKIGGPFTLSENPAYLAERVKLYESFAAKRAAEEQSERQLRDVELESQQTLWRWFLIGVLGLLAAETFVGGWIARSRVASSGLSPT